MGKIKDLFKTIANHCLEVGKVKGDRHKMSMVRKEISTGRAALCSFKEDEDKAAEQIEHWESFTTKLTIPCVDKEDFKKDWKDGK